MESGARLNLLDSDVLIEIQRGAPLAAAWLASFEGMLAIPAAVAWEFLIGSRDKAELRRAQRFLERFAVEDLVPDDSSVARELMSKYALTTGLSIPDFLIAAQAINRSAVLFTFNLKHFGLIPDLTVRAPYIR